MVATLCRKLGGKRTFSLYSCLMEHEAFDPVPMLKFVSAFFAVKLVAAGAILLYALNIESEPPISSTVITMIAVWVPILWFAKVINRPMFGSERLWFAVGNTVAELVFTIAWGLSMFWLTGASFSWEGLSQVLGVGGNPEAAKVGLVVAMTLGWIPVPIFSAFFGWLMTKNLPKEILR